MKLLLVVAALALTNCASKPAPSYDSTATYTYDVSKELPVVRLHMKAKDAFFCTGTIISLRYVLTAAHCLAFMVGKEITIKDIKGNVIDNHGTVVNFEGRSDQGLVLGHFEGLNMTKVEYDPAKNLTAWANSRRLISCGFPYGSTKLLCIVVTGAKNYLFQKSASGNLYPGMSGGPVVDAETGLIIGVNSAVDFDGSIILSPTIEIFSNLGVPVIE